MKSSAFLISVFSLLIISCGDNKSEEPVVEGKNNKVVYSVEFPFIKDKTLLKWFPTEYTTIFNESEIYGEMNSKMNVIVNKFYSNQDSKELNQSLENLSGKYRCAMNATDVNTLVETMPEMIISEPILDTIIVGIPCKKAMAEFRIDSVPAVTLYYTDQINTKTPNWFNQYRVMDAFLMGYEVEQFGMRMKLMAKGVTKTNQEIGPDLVHGEKGAEAYEEMHASELQVVIQNMLDDFME